eukprot:7977664-Pyramimonas_sp.AAC.1
MSRASPLRCPTRAVSFELQPIEAANYSCDLCSPSTELTAHLDHAQQHAAGPVRDVVDDWTARPGVSRSKRGRRATARRQAAQACPRQGGWSWLRRR